MKRTLLIFACLLLAFIAWVFPYIDELRDQGLTMDTAYGYFFGGPDHPFDPNDAAPQLDYSCLLYTSPSPRDLSTSRMPSSA